MHLPYSRPTPKKAIGNALCGIANPFFSILSFFLPQAFISCQAEITSHYFLTENLYTVWLL